MLAMKYSSISMLSSLSSIWIQKKTNFLFKKNANEAQDNQHAGYTSSYIMLQFFFPSWRCISGWLVRPSHVQARDDVMARAFLSCGPTLLKLRKWCSYA